MLSYTLRRFLMIIPTLFGITLITFFVIQLTPGEPAQMEALRMDKSVSASDLERMRELYGLDDPLLLQYWNWLKKFLDLDFGKSFRDNQPVFEKIIERLPNTLSLNAISLVLIFLIGIPIGVISAARQHSFIDRLTTVLAFMGFSAPSFWIALLLMMLLGVNWRVLPISGMSSTGSELWSFWPWFIDRLQHMVMPVIVLSIGGIASISRYMRAGMLEVIRQDYIRTAWAKGLPGYRVIYWHALRNGLLPIVTLVGAMLPTLIGGSFIIESIFAWPGLGRLGYLSILSRDYPVIMGSAVITAVLVLMGNLLSDLGYALVDPRIKFS